MTQAQAKKLEIPEDMYVAVTDLQCCRNALDCIRFVTDERATPIKQQLRNIISGIEEKIS